MASLASLAELTAAHEALRQARALGLREVRDSNGETLTYKSDSEMAAALASLESQINSLSRGPVRQVRFTCSKGN